MARGHGRILTSIWEDEDFKNLDEQQQRMYLFLISQPNLNHAGLLDLTLRRWSRKARGLTVAELEKRIAALEETRFVVVDDDTEELLIRSFVRNDGVWRMPKVMGAMVSGALEITSKRLQQALLAEMDRIPLNELNGEPAKLRNGSEGPSIRQQVAEHIETLRKAFTTPEPDPSRRGSGTPSDTHDEGGPKGSTRGRAGAHMHAAPAPAPTPATNPCPHPTPSAGEGPSSRSGQPVPQAEGLPERMLARWWDTYGPRTAQSKHTVRKAIADALKNGNNPDELWQALVRIGDLSKPVTGGTVQFAFSEIRQAASNVHPIRRSTTDERVAVGLALAAKYREQEQRAALEAGPSAPQETA